MNELGAEVVHKYVGHEPSGRNFNEICLDGHNKGSSINDVYTRRVKRTSKADIRGGCADLQYSM